MPAARSLDEASARTQRGRGGKGGLAASGIWALHGGLGGWLASKSLDSSEKCALGGAEGVRAYPHGESSADEGCVANVELRYAIPIS